MTRQMSKTTVKETSADQQGRTLRSGLSWIPGPGPQAPAARRARPVTPFQAERMVLAGSA